MDIPAAQTGPGLSTDIRRWLLPRLLVNREYGAWAMLLVPAITGMGIAGGWSARIPLFLGAIFCLYLARYPLFLWSRSPSSRLPAGWLFSLAVSLVLGGTLAAPLILRYRLWWLLPLGALALAILLFHLYLARRRWDRSVAGEFLGVLGLALSAPAGYYTLTGSLDPRAWLLWLVCAAFFGSSIFYVKMKVEYPLRRRKAVLTSKSQFVAPLWVYHGGVLATTAILGRLGVVPLWTFLAFLPIAAQALAGGLNLGHRPNLKRLGLTQLGHSLLFAALLIAIFRLSAT
ncbi:MAG: YwiC-like family protein [Chloroflexi bacterium]|nr:YwiC-like family protein [Chloroflexota bacterium]